MITVNAWGSSESWRAEVQSAWGDVPGVNVQFHRTPDGVIEAVEAVRGQVLSVVVITLQPDAAQVEQRDDG